jgi:2-dehydropantoate 2-reductase
MRIIIYGVGAIGGTVAAGLARAGCPVIGIARGARLAAIRGEGLMFRTPDLAERVRFPCVADPGEIAFQPGDAVMLAMKTQDTPAALERLRAAGWREGPVFCAQNGVENERMALRVFPNVHAINVLMPASFSATDEVNAFSTPRHGIFDVGRYPEGTDADDVSMAKALTKGNVAGFADAAVMAAKYGKLLLNLNNVVGAAFGRGAEDGAIRKALRTEAEAVYAAAGIAWRDVGGEDPRRKALMRQGEIGGITPMGSSTAQSLLRGAGSVETDFLNGEIALLGRLNGVPTPVNAFMAELGARLAREGARPGDTPVKTVLEALRAQRVAI